MRCVRLLACAGVAFAAVAGGGRGRSPAAAQPAGTGAYVRTATSPTPQPATRRPSPATAGSGSASRRPGRATPAARCPSQAELAGFYAKPVTPAKASESPQQRANIPTWSALAFSDGGQAFSLTRGRTTGWRQSIDLHTGIISTSATWRAPDGHVTKLVYQVLTDRASQYLGLVRLRLTPRWTGQATVTDLIDGSHAALRPAQGRRG